MEVAKRCEGLFMSGADGSWYVTRFGSAEPVARVPDEQVKRLVLAYVATAHGDQVSFWLVPARAGANELPTVSWVQRYKETESGLAPDEDCRSWNARYPNLVGQVFKSGSDADFGHKVPYKAPDYFSKGREAA